VGHQGGRRETSRRGQHVDPLEIVEEVAPQPSPPSARTPLRRQASTVAGSMRCTIPSGSATAAIVTSVCTRGSVPAKSTATVHRDSSRPRQRSSPAPGEKIDGSTEIVHLTADGELLEASAGLADVGKIETQTA